MDLLANMFEKSLVYVYSYGVILEKFQNKDITLAGRIKGCIVDSAPVAAPDPQVIFYCRIVVHKVPRQHGCWKDIVR